MNKKWFSVFVFCLFISVFSFAQTLRNAVVAFYNVENLYDTEDDPLIDDNEFLPNGKNQWTLERYERKLTSLSTVILKIGERHAPPVIIGLTEIENRRVLEDLCNTANLKPLDYGISHFDSPDRRGVDVALLYQKEKFRVLGEKAYPLIMADTGFKTRDQLLVTGILDNEDTLHIIVNHWPSKRGGEKKSLPRRIAAAQLTRHICDSLFEVNKGAKIIVMGDFNDDPTATSIMKYLQPKVKIEQVVEASLYNPMFKMFKNGTGSYAYRDNWSLIDQIMISKALINTPQNHFQFQGAYVYSPAWLKQKIGAFEGFPFRTYAGGAYIGGYSDHFPVYIILTRQELK